MFETPKWMLDWFDRSFKQYQSNEGIQLNNIIQPKDDFIDYNALPNLNKSAPKIAMVKLNGGLGTSMGCTGPKSLIPCSNNNDRFLDIIIRNYQASSIADHLILLNSFNTSDQTISYMNTNYSNISWTEVMQYPFKKINSQKKLPFEADDLTYYNPPGHGSVYFDLYYSGCLSKLEKDGIEYLFISNADNLAANCDPKIASFMKESNCPFMIELTKKQALDVKGGTIVKSNGQLRLWEIAQVSPHQMDLFQNQPYFNTNNIWVNVHELIETIASGELTLDLILNKKNLHGKPVIQLEYAMGSAVQSFEGSQAIIVPRKRFFPIKNTSDLLLLKSDYASINNGEVSWDSESPVAIQLAPPFNTMDGFNQYFKCIPSIKSVKQLRLSGPIFFNHAISFEGNVSLYTPENKPACINPAIDIIDETNCNNALIFI